MNILEQNASQVLFAWYSVILVRGIIDRYNVSFLVSQY